MRTSSHEAAQASKTSGAVANASTSTTAMDARVVKDIVRMLTRPLPLITPSTGASYFLGIIAAESPRPDVPIMFDIIELLDIIDRRMVW